MCFRSHRKALSAQDIATKLWMNKTMLVSRDTVHRVNLIAEHLRRFGYRIVGTPADGNCFFNSFLRSYQNKASVLRRPMLDTADIGSLRSLLASDTRLSLEQREHLKSNGAWCAWDGEGAYLAKTFRLHVRVVTAEAIDGVGEVNDMLEFPDDRPMQAWDTLDPDEKPPHYLFLIDLTNHFGYAGTSIDSSFTVLESHF
jgi:hypothetical protein